MPTKPYHPHHKGKVERGIGYVKDNALKGRTFVSLREINEHLVAWEAQVADKRIHGTTRKQVGAMFEAQERPALHPLPAMVFPSYREGERKVHRDGFVEVERAYYEAPPEYVGRSLWVRWDSRMVRLFNHRMEEVGLHARAEPGVFSYRPSPGRDRTYDVQRSSRWLLKEAQRIGHACDLALRYGTFRLRDIRRLADHPPATEPQNFAFMTEHELIRDMAFYQAAAQPQGVP